MTESLDLGVESGFLHEGGMEKGTGSAVGDIAAQVAALHGEGEGLPAGAAPVLALGVSERVGSNWLADSLRSVMRGHNEPFRQQLGRQHPLSPRSRVLADLEETGLGPLGRHHLACALSDLYGRPRHLVKETNLFFATGTVLDLLPHSPVLVLTRAPVGIASSFARGGLWERWRYGERYAQVAASARSPRWREAFALLLPQDDPQEAVALGRLIAVNALLLAHALTGRGRTCTVVSYEQHVSDRAAVLASLARDLHIAPLHIPLPRAAGAPGARGGVSADTTFATTGHKTGLVAELGGRTAELVSSHTAATLRHAGKVLEAQVTATAAGWLAGDDLYEVREPAARRRPLIPTPPARSLPRPAYCPVTRVSWRNLLVTNAEMADLLTMLHAAAAPNTRLGTNLLVCPMPHERGGRLHFDVARRCWQVSPGYESHPAYWVTWAGAAAMAAWSGARLPTRAEALEAAVDGRASNCGYAVGDVSSVVEPGRGPGQVHHLVGNVQIWCGDGPTQPPAQPVQRFLSGAAWDTPGTGEAVSAVRSRHLLGSSRGVGVRLVRGPGTTTASGLGAWELAHRLNRWTDALDGPADSLGELDRDLITALAGS